MVCALTIREKTENCTLTKKRALRFALPSGVFVPLFILIVSFVLFLERALNRCILIGVVILEVKIASHVHKTVQSSAFSKRPPVPGRIQKHCCENDAYMMQLSCYK
jgi:hypothetical protein